MKRITFVFILCTACFTGCKTNKPITGMNSPVAQTPDVNSADVQQPVNYSEQSTWLLGYFTQGQLMKEPHSVWFYKGYDEYQPDTGAMRSLSGISKDGLAIKIIMGTWCPDSRREVPRFIKVMDDWQFPAEMITFIGVDNGKNSPIGGYEMFEIHRVPTFIIFKNNIEAGRIIENPETSLEQDMVKILGGMNNNK
jgi:thiol-disulfide isomerase/thioredoxin